MENKFQIAARLLLLVVLVFTLTSAASGAGQAAAAAAAPQAEKAVTGAGAVLQQPAQIKSFVPAGPPGLDPALLERLKRNARGSVSVSADKSTGSARFLRVSQGGDLQPGNAAREPQGKAVGFFAEYGRLFGVGNAGNELVQVGATKDKFGVTHLEYRQVHRGVPVFAAILRAHVDAAANLTAVNGVFVPDLDVDTNAALSASDAARIAIQDVVSNPPDAENPADVKVSVGSLKAASNTLYVYRDGLIQGVPGPNLLVYEVVVTDEAAVREYVYVDAHTGAIVNRYSDVHGALFRRLFEQTYGNQVWQEGDPFPGSLNPDQANIVDFSGDSYYLFFNAFGVDSYDGLGAEMQTVNNDPRINCPNANWNGITTNYCNGVTSDDVVAHEWGHAYTDYTHNLIYQWQSGALNESYSDIWGEVVDILNGKGTDSPATVRSDGTCSAYTPPVPVMVINSPASIADVYPAGAASFGPALSAVGVTGDVVLGDDGAGAPNDACSALVNNVSGKIALVDRGTCAFVIKVKNAQNAGAVGVLVANNAPGAPAGMGGADPTITIPSVMISQAAGSLIRGELANGVNATIRRGSGEIQDSYRWLMGEDSTAFGGAIRDMWNPVCMADPGKVSDGQYHCATTDGGGVHTNSGVPNHGFALLVDGGTYNGQTINAIGVTKAAHIYWRAQSVYQTPVSNFVDHADSLEASCSDLVGQPLDALGTGTGDPGVSGEVITAGDCAEVSKMVEAVELRLDPAAQCNFQPILQQNPPALCTTGSTPIYNENFEEGLNGWTVTNQGVYSGWPGFNWVSTKDLPRGWKGQAAFATDPIAGSCDAGAGDISGVMRLESPAIKVPPGAKVDLKLAFSHYVATEAGWDGGNLSVSINGGPYTLVPSSAFQFNPYNTILQTAAAGNTNPLAGQPAYSGTDGGSLVSSWGQSQVSLAALGVKPGDTIRLRYDFGMDGCNGNDGWYVDNVTVVACKAK